MTLSVYAKNEIAKWMLYRGHSFLKSAILLKKAGGSHDVELYNVCQGIEVVLKGLLLFKNYDKYKPLLPNKKTYGHNLINLANAVITEYRFRPLSKAQTDELEILNKYYTSHYLRYSGVHDIFFPATDVEYSLCLRKLIAAIKLAENVLKNAI